MDPQTHRWWTLLRGASVVNVLLLALTVIASGGSVRQLACAAVYTFVCAFRSFLPRVDLERTVLIDHPLSSIAIGRTAATIAEMAFTLQLSWFTASLPTGSAVLGAALVGGIAVAQVCCWLGVLTLDHRWHAAEEVLWAAAMVAVAAVFSTSRPQAEGLNPLILPFGVLGCAGAAWVMAVLDVPMYIRRWRDGVARGERHLGVGVGMLDAATRRAPTGAWDVWQREVAWMTPYFTVGVWISLALAWIAR